MANLYLITGPCGVGKSTISRHLAEQLSKSVLLEGDDFYHHVVSGYVQAWKEGNHLDIFWKVVIDTINNYLNAGYDVVFNYIINKDNFISLKDEFKKIDTKFIVLLADSNTLLERDSKRPIDCQMKDRCVLLLDKFLNYGFDKKYLLYEDELNIDEVVNKIISNDDFIIR